MKNRTDENLDRVAYVIIGGVLFWWFVQVMRLLFT